MSSHPVQALIFDFFGVLVEYDETILNRRLAPFCPDPDAALAAMGNLGAEHDVNTGEATIADVQQRVAAQFGLEMALEDFERAWSRSYSWPMPGMDDLLRELSQRYRLVLLSNIDSYYWNNVYRDYEPLRQFHRVLLSFELGVAKPDAEAFVLATKAAECDFGACLFIDDRESNTNAAAALGMQTHTFTSTEAFRADLTKRGLL
jgi:HAD superfamily hydrolase (TIGR01509 family)